MQNIKTSILGFNYKTFKTSLLSLSLVATSILGNACFIESLPAQRDLGLIWNFDQDIGCAESRVRSLDVTIYDSSGTAVYSEQRLPCTDDGILITDMIAQSYQIDVQAFDGRDNVLYQTQNDFMLERGYDTKNQSIHMLRKNLGLTGIAFDWDFAGERDCLRAGVAELDLQLIDASGQSQHIQKSACYNAGLIMENIDPGSYRLYLDAYSDNNDYLYAEAVDVLVEEGKLTELGLLTFDVVEAQANNQNPNHNTNDRSVSNSGVELLWGFMYPNENLESSCLLAGADVITVFVEDDRGTLVYERELSCDDELVGLAIDDLSPGNYQLLLKGFQSIDDQLLQNYETASIDFEVLVNSITELDQIPLERLNDAFGDLEVNPTNSQLCQNDDQQIIEIELLRLLTSANGSEKEIFEDGFELSCQDLGVIRETYLPGLYRLDAFVKGDRSDSESISFKMIANEKAIVSLLL